MPRSSFQHIDTWVFDLDNTLYPPHMRLFDQIEEKMTNYVIREVGVPREQANEMRHDYWVKYGTTLAGLMDRHGVDPGPYLTEVHDISFAQILPDPDLAKAIGQLPGRKIIYTNGTAPYAERVVDARGLTGLFDQIYGVEHANYHPKPKRKAFEKVFSQARIKPENAAMFEDDQRNLSVPHAMGMQTVHVAPEALDAEHIHYHTADLAAFLEKLTA